MFICHSFVMVLLTAHVVYFCNDFHIIAHFKYPGNGHES